MAAPPRTVLSWMYRPQPASCAGGRRTPWAADRTLAS